MQNHPFDASEGIGGPNTHNLVQTVSKHVPTTLQPHEQQVERETSAELLPMDSLAIILEYIEPSHYNDFQLTCKLFSKVFDSSPVSLPKRIHRLMHHEMEKLKDPSIRSQVFRVFCRYQMMEKCELLKSDILSKWTSFESEFKSRQVFNMTKIHKLLSRMKIIHTESSQIKHDEYLNVIIRIHDFDYNISWSHKRSDYDNHCYDTEFSVNYYPSYDDLNYVKYLWNSAFSTSLKDNIYTYEPDIRVSEMSLEVLSKLDLTANECSLFFYSGIMKAINDEVFVGTIEGMIF